jgi:hypothetical protein
VVEVTLRPMSVISLPRPPMPDETHDLEALIK